MTLRSLLCLDYGSGICMRRAPRDSCSSLERVSTECTWIKHMIQDLCYTLDNHTTIGRPTYDSFNYFV